MRINCLQREIEKNKGKLKNMLNNKEKIENIINYLHEKYVEKKNSSS
jgi:hypothetical protein